MDYIKWKIRELKSLIKITTNDETKMLLYKELKKWERKMNKIFKI